jgi:uncharacterized protein (DUF302 family)
VSVVVGLITIRSNHSVAGTIDRLQDAAAAAGLHVFARVDHAAGAAQVDMELRDTLLLIFGNPRGGTPLMIANQTAGIDLPIKALAFEDADGEVWLSYNDPAWIAARHHLDAAAAPAVQAMADGLARLMAKATAADQ